MGSSRPLSIHLSLYFMFAAMVPIIAISAMILIHLSSWVVDEVKAKNMMLARSSAEKVEAFLDSPLHMLHNIGGLIHSGIDLDNDDIGKVLNAYVATSAADLVVDEDYKGLFESVYLLGPDGRVQAVGLSKGGGERANSLLGIDLSHRDFYKRAKQTLGPSWSKTFLSLISGKMSLALCLPIDRDYVLVGNFNFELLAKLIAERDTSTDVTTALIDAGGYVIAHTDKEVAARQINVSNIELVRKALGGEEATDKYVFEGTEYLASATVLMGPGWAVLVSQPTQSAFSSIYRGGAIALLGALASMIIAVMMAFRAGEKYSRPLAQLAGQAREVADGGYAAPEVSSAYLELDRMSASIREMVQSILQREHELAQSEKKYKDLSNLLPQVVYEIDTEGAITYANRRGAEMMGYGSEEELLGIAIENLVIPEDRPQLHIAVERLLAGESLDTGEYRLLKKDGTTFPALTFSAPISDDGKVVGVRGILAEITERKKLEAQLMHSQKMEAVGTLASGIAHDFNNLLQIISGYAQMLKLEADEGKPNIDYINRIDTASNNASELVRQILTFSRKSVESLAPLSLNEEVKKAVVLLERTIPKMVSIETRFDPCCGNINANSTQLEQIIMNLASNASHAMPEGGALSFSTRWATLEEPLVDQHGEVSPGEYVILTIADTGMGMASETVDRIFEPFFTTKGVGEGTGLGLSTVYGIMKGHGGYIQCESAKGAGTTFTLYFPMTGEKECEVPIAEDGHEGQASVAGRRILVVDDERDIRELAKRLLESAGYLLLEADCGEKALEVYDANRQAIDLVLLDLGMPGMGGKACLMKLLERNPALKVVVASGYSTDSHAKSVTEVGASAFISKPYRIKEFLSVVRQVLDD